MVDINLIGDDNLGDEKTEERTEGEQEVVDYTQTSSMDTEELAFEERTETFDTTRTAGLAHQRNYSSLLSTFIILGVIAILAVALYFFIFDDSTTGDPTEVAESIPDDPSPDQSQPAQSDPQSEQPLNEETQPPESSTPQDIPIPTQTTTTSSAVSEEVNIVTERFLANSAMAIETVNNVLNSTPPDLSTTLLSYAGNRIRFEFVVPNSDRAQGFVTQLNQIVGSNDISILSESDIDPNGQAMKKVLVAGTVGAGGTATGGQMAVWDLEQIESWVRSSASQIGLEVRQLKAQQGRMTDGYLRTPMQLRLVGSKSSLSNFLTEMGARNLNIELTKILFVSPDMASYDDSTLILVLMVSVYQPA